ncbi:hypothetical protein KF728_17790 [Candidatus Obscuribacterales bacterium]|nr:hypothetical protein [Candidatus Obscuribacterales bacterium]
MQNPTKDLKPANKLLAHRDGTGNSSAENVTAAGKPVPVLDAFTEVAPLGAFTDTAPLTAFTDTTPPDAFTDEAPLEEPCEFFTDWQLPNPIRKPATGR